MGVDSGLGTFRGGKKGRAWVGTGVHVVLDGVGGPLDIVRTPSGESFAHPAAGVWDGLEAVGLAYEDTVAVCMGTCKM